jgi:sugar-specific transcriptional regulator TrmB
VANELIDVQEALHLLTEVGLTQLQAKLYFTLLRIGKTEAGTLVKSIDVARTEIYRSLDELQKRGLVEREMSRPYKFKPTPLREGLQFLMLQRFQQYQEMERKAEAILQKIQDDKKETNQQFEYEITIIEGREKILQKIALQHDKVHRNTEILSTAQRWLQIIQHCIRNYENALRRGVKYRIVIDKTDCASSFDNLKGLFSQPNFELRISNAPLKTNAAIFDGQEVTIAMYPSRLLKESPMLLTKHPSFVSMCQDHFENVWRSAQSYQFYSI